MKCPNCDSENHTVIDTVPDGSYIWRNRKCKDCGHIWPTGECADEPPIPVRSLRYQKRIVAKD